MIATTALWFAVVIRCEQASDTCTKHTTQHVSEARCETAMQARVDQIGQTSDIVIGVCLSEDDE